MKNSTSLALLIIVLLGCTPCWAQVSSNPFDIQSRKAATDQDTVSQEAEPVTLTTEAADNAFEIQREGASAAPVTSEAQQEALPQGNPFEVSHVPLRASKLKSEADAFKPRVKHESKKVTDVLGEVKEDYPNTFIFWLVLISSGLLAVVINTKRNVILKTARGILNQNILKSSLREQNGGWSGHFLMLYLIFFINASIFTYLLLTRYTDYSGLKVFGLVTLAVLGIYLLRHVLLFLLGFAFPIKEETRLYNYAIQHFNVFAGLVLMPLNLVVAFGPPSLSTTFLYITLAAIGILLLLRYLRGLNISMRYAVGSTFHFLLYLCAFEIVPILLFIKFAVNS